MEDAFNALAQSEARRDEVLREIAALQRVLDLSQQSYTAGVIPLTDVLDADRQLLVAKDDLAVSRESARDRRLPLFAPSAADGCDRYFIKKTMFIVPTWVSGYLGVDRK